MPLRSRRQIRASAVSRTVRIIFFAIVIISFTACGAMGLFENQAVTWLHIVLLAAAFAVLSGPYGTWLRRAIRGFSIGLATSIMLVAIALAVGWIIDRRHFFDDGGPLAALFIIELYIGLPAALLGAVLSGLATPAGRVVTRFRTPQSG